MEQTRFIAGKDRGTVLLDGIELKEVVECDTKFGFAIVYLRDEHGNLKIEGADVAMAMLTGKIEFFPTVTEQ